MRGGCFYIFFLWRDTASPGTAGTDSVRPLRRLWSHGRTAVGLENDDDRI